MYLDANKALKNILLSFILFSSFVSYAQQGAGDNAVVSEVRNKVDNTPTSISFSASAGLRQDQAQQILSKYLQYSPGGDIDMRFRNTITTKTNITTQRFDEYYKGVKVAYGGFTLTGKDGVVGFMTGNFYKPVGDPTATPGITEATAFANALSFVGAEKYRWQDAHSELFIKKRYHNNDTSYLPKAQLIWVEDMRSGLKDHKLHLAYSFDIFAEKPLSRQLVYIDAATGKVLFADQLIKHTAATGASKYSGTVPFQTANTLGTYYLFDSTRGDGVYTMNMENGTDYFAASDYTSITNTWPVAPVDNVALDAHWGAEVVYDYLFSQHGRLSWDGSNGILMQYVHYGVNYNNAFWNGSEMTYGDGTGFAAGGFTSLVSLDVTAHEIGHGICQATCGLIYESEPGALNEAFSDCWGATIEHWGDPHEVDAMPKNAWEMGEEISTEPLRSLNTPLLQGQPNTYGSTNWFNVVGCTPVGGSGGNDNCGVHRNSGLMNYWYYLLVNGGAGTNGIGNSYVVNAVGWTKAANILYASELALSSVAEYADMRTTSINAANILYGPCSPEAQSVTSAWYAVGVGPNYVPCVPQISFTTTSARTTEAAAATTCTASHTFNVGLKPIGTVVGGNPVANILIAPTSTAVLGVDFILSTTSVTFIAGDPSTKFFTVTVFDNGAVNDDKHIDFAFTVSPMGTGAVVAPYNDSMTLYIDNNDSIPHLGGTIYPVLNQGIPVTSDFTTAFYGKRRRSRSQFLLYANELAAAGVVPGVPISQIAFNVLTKSSTAPFIGYTISMRNTNVADLYSSFVTGLTQVYTGDYTTSLGMNAIDFNTGTFTWDGTSNVVVQLCFGMTPAAFSANDKVAGVQQGSYIIGDYENTNGGSGDGCTLGFNTGNRAVIRPVMRFKQDVPPSAIETTAASNRVYNVRSGQEVYFYSTADTQVIAGIKGMDFDLGCVTATVTQQGNGVVPATFSAINRSLKEVNIVPTINGGITTYDVTFYMTTAELAGVSPSSLFILKTDAPTDATVSTANSVVLTPTIITAGNYTGFRATCTGFSRFMLVDGPLCNTPDAHITAGGPTTFCLGGSVGLSTPFGALLSYQWQREGANIPGATDFNYTATLGGDYTVIVNQNVCDSVSLPFTVTVDSAFAATISGAGSVCQGQTITLSDPTPGGVWASSNIAVATVSASGVVTGVAAGTATISYSATNPCGTATSTFVVTVNALSPVAPVTGTFSVCNTYTTALSDATTPGVWSSGATGIATVGLTGVVTGVSPGVATISYAFTNGFGCVSYATADVSVNVTPAAMTSPTGAFAICTGVTATFNATPATAGHTYQWQDGGVDIAGATSSVYLTPTPGTYRVLVTNIFGCLGTSPDVILTVGATATVTPTVTLSTSAGGFNFCETTTPVTFTATPVFGGGAPTYQWSVNGTIVGGTGPTYAYVPANGDIVACQLNSSYPCASPSIATTSETLVVNPLLLPVVSVNPVPNDTVCTGGSVTYAAVPVNGGTFPTYTWTENGTLVASGPTYSTAPSDGDIIVCQMTSNAVCRSTSVVNSSPFVMSVQPYVVQSVAISVSPTVLTPGVPMTFVAVTTNAGPAPAYQWFINATPVPGATNITYVSSSLTAGQVVSCKVTSSLICASPHIVLSGGITVKTATGGTGVSGIDGGNALTLLPNPNKGVFTIAGATGLANGESITISVVNMLGQEIYTKATEASNGTLNQEVTLPHNIAAGMYIVSVTSGQLRQVFHVSVDK
jgi:Zn-dependent metalloprotease